MGKKVLGGTASKTQKALAGTTQALNRMEQKGKEMGGLRGGFLRSASIAARPFGWSASGLNRAAGQRLIEFAAEREKMTLPQGF